MQVQQSQFQLQNGVATSNNNQVLLVNLPEKPSRRKYYPVCQSIFLGFLQILCGAGSIIIAGLMVENQTTIWFVGHGFWCGGLAFISGCFSVGAGCSKSKCPIVCSLVFSIFGVLFIGFQIGIAIFSAIYYGFLVYQYPYNYYNNPLTSSTTTSLYALHSSTTSSSTFLSTDSSFTSYQQYVISIILASFGALMWFLACWMSCIGCHFSCCYCCAGCCCPCYSPRVTRIRTQQTMMVQVPPNNNNMNQPILNGYQPTPTFQQPNPMNQPVQPNYPAQQFQPNYPLQHFQPNQQNLQPNQQFIQPNQPFIQPNQQFVQPNQQYVQPNQQSVQPNQQFVQPNQQFVQPNQLSVQPNQPDRPVQPVQPFQLSDPHTYTHLQQNPNNYEPLIRDNEQTLNRNKIVSQSPPEYFEINNSVCYSEDRSHSINNLRPRHDNLYDELERVESSGRDPTSSYDLGVMDGSRDRIQHDDVLGRAEPQYQDCDAQGRYEATLNYNNSPAGTENSYYLN